MASQSVCSSLCFHKTKSTNHRSSLERICSPPSGVICGRNHRFQSNYGRKSLSLGLKWVNNDFRLLRVNKVARVSASVCDLGDKLTQGSEIENVRGRGNDGFDPLRGKSGSVSFYGITHQMVEEGKLESAPFKRGTGSFLWLSAPLVLIMSLVLPPLLVGNAVNVMIKDAILAGNTVLGGHHFFKIRHSDRSIRLVPAQLADWSVFHGPPISRRAQLAL